MNSNCDVRIQIIERVVTGIYTNIFNTLIYDYKMITNNCKNQEKKNPTWDDQGNGMILAIIKELQVITLIDEKKFRTSKIFKKVEGKGYYKTIIFRQIYSEGKYVN